eukprot:Gb_10873 [translate_table: standard]
MEMAGGYIMVVPFHGQGHVFPCLELCKQLAARGVAVTIVASRSIRSSLQSIANHDASGLGVRIMELREATSEEQDAHPGPFLTDTLQEPFEEMLNNLAAEAAPLPLCVIGDVMVGWVTTVCDKFHIPRVPFFTSSACSIAFEYALWKHRPLDLKEDEAFAVPGFPESMPIALSDTLHRAPPPPDHHQRNPPPFPRRGHPPPPDRGHPPPFGHGGPPHGPPHPPTGPDSNPRSPPWMNGLNESSGFLVNTCRELEAPFIEYMVKETEKPVWAVGPLLPSSFWEGSITHDSSFRSRKSNIDEKQCLEWLNSKPPASVLYVSFGSEVGPSEEEIRELAYGLEAAQKPFIWVLQAGHHHPHHQEEAEEQDLLPAGFEHRLEGRGLIIRGWAPQLLILSHPSTGGFLSHCGWNSTVESIGHGVPLLAWPIRGDQHYNAKLLVAELKVAAMIHMPKDDGMVRREEIAKGVDVLLGSEHGEKLRERAVSLKLRLASCSGSSQKMLDAFVVHLSSLQKKL